VAPINRTKMKLQSINLATNLKIPLKYKHINFRLHKEIKNGTDTCKDSTILIKIQTDIIFRFLETPVKSKR